MRILSLLLFCPAFLLSQSIEEKYGEVSKKIIDAAMKDEGGWSKLAYLCDRIGNRLSGSEGFTKAVAWSAATMKEAGLENVQTPTGPQVPRTAPSTSGTVLDELRKLEEQRQTQTPAEPQTPQSQ